MAYLWLKALHVAAAATWVGGLLVAALAVAAVPTAAGASPDGGRRWLDAVRRWDRGVTSPAMLLVWALGIAMAVQGGWFASRWLLVKLAIVLALSALHGALSGSLRRAARNAGPSPLAERPVGPSIVAAVVAIAFLAVLKPF